MSSHETEETTPEMWLRTRPKIMQMLIRRFPPECQVRSKPPHSHQVPADGGMATVIGYNDIENEIIVHGDDADGRGWQAYCNPDHIELVLEHEDWTQAHVAQILDTVGDA